MTSPAERYAARRRAERQSPKADGRDSANGDPVFDISLVGADVTDTSMDLSISLKMRIPKGPGSEEERRRIIQIMKGTSLAHIYLMINEKMKQAGADEEAPVP